MKLYSFNFDLSMNSQQFLSSAYLFQPDQLPCNKHNYTKANDERNLQFCSEQSTQTIDSNIQSKNIFIQQKKQKSKHKLQRALKKEAKQGAKRAKEEKLARMAAQEIETNREKAGKLGKAFLPQFDKNTSKEIIALKSDLLCRRVFQWDNSIYKEPKQRPKTLFKKLIRELL